MQGKKSVDDKKGQNSLNRNNQGRGGGGEAEQSSEKKLKSRLLSTFEWAYAKKNERKWKARREP